MSNPHQNIKEKIKEEFMRCAADPVYFMKKYYMIQHPQRGRLLFDLYPFQSKVLHLFQKNDYAIINKSRQLGISTLVSAYSLWTMLFQKDKNVLVIATTQATAKNMVTKVRFAYQNLPAWLKIGASEDNRLSLRLVNGSQIKAVSAATDAARSEAVSLLIIDEAAFIDNIDSIFTAAQQTLATGGGCIALSTPNGMMNWFHKTYTAAQKKENRFLPISLPWTVHPERDQVWRDQQTVELGARNAAQECDCDFASSGNTFIDPGILKWYEENTLREPIERREGDRNMWIWEYPDPTRNYMLVADVARGDGNDFSGFHIIDIETMTQVAEYKGQLGTREYAGLLLTYATMYNYALLVIEHASIGWDVIQTVLEKEYPNVYYSQRGEYNLSLETYINKFDRGTGLVPGFSTNEKTRPLMLEKMRVVLESKAVVIRSIRFLEELRVFIWKNNKPQAMQGYNDDLVMPFSIGMFLRETSLRFKTNMEDLTRSALGGMQKVSDLVEIKNTGNHFIQNTGWTMNVPSMNGNIEEDISWILG